MASRRILQEPADVLFRIQRGLSGYVSYLAACEMNQSFSEYVLYEPILRILTARNYSVQTEVECPGIKHATTGDRKRIDLVATGPSARFAMEVKWKKARTLDVKRDYHKLKAFLESERCSGSQAFLCIFGRKSQIGKLKPRPEHFREYREPVYAEFRRTKYGCRIYEIA